MIVTNPPTDTKITEVHRNISINTFIRYFPFKINSASKYLSVRKIRADTIQDEHKLYLFLILQQTHRYGRNADTQHNHP